MALTSDERRRQSLLEWLYEKGPGNHLVDLFYDGVDRRMIVAHEDLRALEALGLIRPEFQGGGTSYAELKADGRSAIERLRIERADRPSRNRALRAEMLRWLYDVGARSEAGYLPTWDEFLADPRAEFLGEHFSLDEVEENAGKRTTTGMSSP